MYVWLHKKLPRCCFICSIVFGIVSFLNFSHSSGHAVLSILVLICIALMNNSGEHLFMCPLIHPYILLWEVSVQLFCPFGGQFIFLHHLFSMYAVKQRKQHKIGCKILTFTWLLPPQVCDPKTRWSHWTSEACTLEYNFEN